MASKFGFLSRLEFLQDLASALISRVNPAVVHNLEKYYALKKVHYLSSIENIEGDYLEFGVFTGSSFCHSIRCSRRMNKINPNVLSTRFFGFDSFCGFGTLSEDDTHSFYTDENFETNLLILYNGLESVFLKTSQHEEESSVFPKRVCLPNLQILYFKTTSLQDAS